jgi:poly(A) polymerase
MFKFIMNLFRKRSLTLDEILVYPEGLRIYKEVHGLRKNVMDEDALKIIHRLNRFGHKAYLVGGCVRDLLLGRKPKDFDIATSATPNQIKNIFNNCRIIGKRFKIVHILFRGKVIEVSTFRSLPDHRMNKNVTKDSDLLLKRDNNFGTAKEDAARRDFTVNALYYDPRNESIIDFVGGYEDIKNKIVKVVGDPDISFKEDPVRMLRAVKISVLHNLKIEKKTSIAIKKNKLEIEKSSTSRMLEEYNKIYRTMETAIIFKGLAEHQILDVLFKEALEQTKKTPGWDEKFLESNIGKRLQIADRKIKEREDLTPVIYYALIFSDIVKEALAKEKGHMVPIIKNALDPICKRLEIPKRDKDRLIKTFASQKRFKIINENNVTQNELFKAKDFFYDAFMYFKINAEAEKDEVGIQAAFFWEISARIRPKSTAIPNRNNNRFEKKKKEKSKFNKKSENFQNKFHKNEEEEDNEFESILENDNIDSIPDSLDEDLNDILPEDSQANSKENVSNNKDEKQAFPKKKKYRPKRFRKFNNKKGKKPESEENKGNATP